MPSNPTQSPRHIMAINNDADVLNAFRDLLEEEGYRVTTQIYADRNLGAIVQLAPALIILDSMWSSDDGGWSLLQMLRMDPRTAQIPIVLCTGAVREVEALKGRLDEMRVRVVLKPFNIDELTVTIASEFDGAQKTE
jgi:CheY-like chemotaxis protein